MKNLETSQHELLTGAALECKKLKCDEYTLVLYEKNDFCLQMLEDKVESITHGETSEFYGRILKNNRKCTFSTNARINDQIKKNVEFLEHLSEDKYAAIENSESGEYAAEYYNDNDLKQEEAMEIINEFNKGLHEVAPQAKSNSGININHHMKFLQNSYDLFYKSTLWSKSMFALAHLNTPSNNVEIYDEREFFDLNMAFEYGKNIGNRLLLKLDETVLDTGEYDVLLTRSFVDFFARQFLSPLFGYSIAAKTSFLADKLNQLVFPSDINIVSNPEHFLFDSDGVELKKIDLVKNGVIQNFILNKYNAKKLNMETTGHCLSLFGEGYISIDFNHNMKSASIKDRSYLEIEDYSGKNVNTTTGDFSALVNGLIVKNGQKIGSFNDVILSGNMLEFCKKMYLLDDYEKKNNFGLHCPSIFIENCKICGK